MKFRRRRRPGRGGSTVELTPLIDVVLLLLIFFVVSTTFVRQSVLDVQLPQADGGQPERRASDIEIRISAAGEYAVNDRRLADGELATLLRALSSETGERLVVAADAAARHEAVVRALDAAGRSGLTQVRILTRQGEAKDARDDAD